ncbi:MAG TPA: zinc-ribbon domain-containing protein, partial [Anaeromyxobacteraceae bacterium]|nr:zinc-ribbon domain-containing protein [Anaeromyxobacteraceae bacterium]
MIVVCTGCSAKFKVADEKVGPRGAKLRCSKCQTVFVVQRQDAAPLPDPGGLLGAPAAPPPLPRREATSSFLTAPTVTTELGAQLDARPGLDIDLEPAAPRGRPVADPFAVAPPTDDPFASPAPAFGAPAPPAPGDDPFASAGHAVHD